MPGISCPRCGSPARIGLPLAVRAPATAKAFDPATTGSSSALEARRLRQAREAAEAREVGSGGGGERRGVGDEEDVVPVARGRRNARTDAGSGGELLASRCAAHAVGQLLVHQEEDGEGVGRAPRLGLGPEERELEPEAARAARRSTR